MYSTELRDNNLTVNARQRRNQNSNLVYATSKGSLAYTAFSSENSSQSHMAEWQCFDGNAPLLIPSQSHDKL